MATQDSEYTSIDFLSKIRLQPKKNLFKQLSLNTDLEEINQFLSPKSKVEPQPQPTTVDLQLTKRFVVELITRYESESEATSKWEAFLKSLESTQTFEIFVSSLKDIKESKKEQLMPNPENESSKLEIELKPQLKTRRSTSASKFANKRQPSSKVIPLKTGLKQKIKEQLASLKDLLLAGEKFIRQIVTDYE